MSRRTVLVTIPTVAIAGCIDETPPSDGGDDPADTDDDASDDDGAETPTETDADPDDSLRPPGIDDDGLSDPDELLSAHEAALSERSFTYEHALTTTTDDGEPIESETARLDVDGTEAMVVETIDRLDDDERRIGRYIDEDDGFRYRHADDETIVDRVDDGEVEAIRTTFLPLVSETLSLFEFGQPEDDRSDDSRVVRLRVVGITEEADEVIDEEDADEISSELLVDADGVIRSLEVTGVRVPHPEDPNARFDVETTVKNLDGATVTEPEWTADVETPPEVDDVETYDGWLDDVPEYHGPEERTGEETVTVLVGADDGFRFDPPAVIVDAGTTVRWEWTGEGGAHDVSAVDGTFESEVTDEEGHTFEHTFDDTGVYRYHCRPHDAIGMRGVVEVT